MNFKNAQEIFKNIYDSDCLYAIRLNQAYYLYTDKKKVDYLRDLFAKTKKNAIIYDCSDVLEIKKFFSVRHLEREIERSINQTSEYERYNEIISEVERELASEIEREVNR
jgi:hypothetical protein